MKNQDHIICREMDSVSLLNPLADGDSVTLDGVKGSELWTVKQGGYGWQLRSMADNCVHPKIKDISGMSDFIGAILETIHNS